ANVRGAVSPAVWSPDGKTLAVCSLKTITLVDAVQGKELATLPTEGRLSGGVLHFSKDGKKLYTQGTLSPAVAERDASTGKLLRTFGSEQLSMATAFGTSQLRGMSLSPDGNTLCLAGLERVPVFIDLPSGKEVDLPGGHSKPVLLIQFSPDAKTMLTAAGENK